MEIKFVSHTKLLKYFIGIQMVNAQIVHASLFAILILITLVIILIIIIDSISRRGSLEAISPNPIPSPTPGPSPSPNPPSSGTTRNINIPPMLTAFTLPPTTDNLRVAVNSQFDFPLIVPAAPSALPRLSRSIQVFNNSRRRNVILEGRGGAVFSPRPNPIVPPRSVSNFVSSGVEMTNTGPREVFTLESTQ